MNELKPCPFCGGKARHSPDDRSIYCAECDAEGPRHADRFGRALKERAIAAWNRRTKGNDDE